jgi:hypothetical protein
MKTSLTRTGVICYLAAIFMVGGVAGWIGGYCAGSHAAFQPPRGAALTALMTSYLKSKLHVTDKQLEQLQPILNETAAQFEAIHTNSAARVNEVFQHANERIAPFLDADQKALLAGLERQRQEKFKRFLKPEPAVAHQSP